MEKVVLHREPWIYYFDEFSRDKNVLSYPKNLIFTAQFLTEHLKYASEHIYPKHLFPFAEKFNLFPLNEIDWKTNIIVFDKHSNILLAPEPVKDLVNLDRRLRYAEARDAIFGGFRFFPEFLEIFHLRWFVFFICVSALLFLYRDKIHLLFRRRVPRRRLP